MRHRSKKVTLDRKADARHALLKNLVFQLVMHEKITTTEAKAKALRPVVERLITRGKQNSLANRRSLLRALPTEQAVAKILEVLGPRYASRPGGYTRIVKRVARKGDGAQMAVIEFVKEQ